MVEQRKTGNRSYLQPGSIPKAFNSISHKPSKHSPVQRNRNTTKSVKYPDFVSVKHCETNIVLVFLLLTFKNISNLFLMFILDEFEHVFFAGEEVVINPF